MMLLSDIGYKSAQVGQMLKLAVCRILTGTCTHCVKGGGTSDYFI